MIDPTLLILLAFLGLAAIAVLVVVTVGLLIIDVNNISDEELRALGIDPITYELIEPHSFACRRQHD